MKHHVFWFPAADLALQHLISQSDDPQKLVNAARTIDHWLVFDPEHFGESRFENVRVAFIPPLGIQFEILDNPPTVIVIDIWKFRA